VGAIALGKAAEKVGIGVKEGRKGIFADPDPYKLPDPDPATYGVHLRL
jgi:hypothetical protein